MTDDRSLEGWARIISRSAAQARGEASLTSSAAVRAVLLFRGGTYPTGHQIERVAPNGDGGACYHVTDEDGYKEYVVATPTPRGWDLKFSTTEVGSQPHYEATVTWEGVISTPA